MMTSLICAAALVASAAGETATIQKAIDDCAAAGGGCVRVPAGEHLCGSLRLRSGVELNLAEGATLVCSTNRADYFEVPESVTTVAPEKSKLAFLYAWGETNVAITGKGRIDGRGPAFFDEHPNARFWPKPALPRPRLVELVDCHGIRMSGVTFKDSSGWTMLIRRCSNLEFDGITVDNDPRMINSDGIDIDSCRNVRIVRSRLRTGDDSIILRAMAEGTRRTACENVTIEDCDLDSACQAIRIGCPSDGDIRHAVFRNIRAAGYNGINFEFPVRYLRRGDRGSVAVSDLLFDGFRGTFSNRAVQITAGPGVAIHGVRDVTFRHFDVKAGRPPLFAGNADSALSNVVLEDFSSTSPVAAAPYEARATEPLVLRRCAFNGTRVPDAEITAPRGRREPLVRGRIGWRIGQSCRLVAEDVWYGYRRIVFDFQGEEAWVVLPKNDNPPPGVNWTWTMEWPSAFVRRTGALEMLARGWPHVTLRPGHYKEDGETFVHTVGNMNDERLRRCRAFQQFLGDELEFAPKTHLIGMSWGGFYSIRYAGTYPDAVRRMYLDAPLCDFTTTPGWARKERDCRSYYGLPFDFVGRDDPRMPVNMAEPIARSGVEVLLLYGKDDQVVPAALNCERWRATFLAANGKLQDGILDEDGRGRDAYGHHPHGLEIDQQHKLAAFFEHGVSAPKPVFEAESCRFVLGAAAATAAESAPYDIGKDMETEAFWKTDPVIFLQHHQKAHGFKFTSDAREQADSRRDGAVLWHGLEVYETRIMFGPQGGVDRVEVVLFNTGGTEKLEEVRGTGGGRAFRRVRVDKTISPEEFKVLVGKAQAKLTPDGAKKPSVAKDRIKDTDIRQCVQTWPKTGLGTATTLTWNYKKGAKKADPLVPGFVRLATDGPGRAASAPAKGKSSASRTGGGAAVRSKKLSLNVHEKDARGDVYVDNIPMVDQGAKGYCAAAASERILRYFGTDVDEHEIAAAAGTKAESGTSVDAMAETVRLLGRKYKFAVQTVAGDAGESNEKKIANLGKRVDQYNKMAKKMKKAQISEDVYVRREGNMVSYSPGAVEEAMDPEVKKEMKTNGPGKAKYQAFLKTVRKNVDAGQPLLWGVTLGVYPESDLPQARGGHMRLIIGYNDKKGEILYSDTWGQGHELKRMPSNWAWTITDTLLSVRPL